MPHRKQQRWIEAQHSTRVITVVWMWVLGTVTAVLSFLGLTYWLVPALFFWIVFGLLLGG